MVLFVALVCAAWIVPGLIGHDPWKPDEAYSFGLVLSLMEGRDWVVPLLAQEPFMEKPPIYYLTAALSATSYLPDATPGRIPCHGRISCLISNGADFFRIARSAWS